MGFRKFSKEPPLTHESVEYNESPGYSMKQTKTGKYHRKNHNRDVEHVLEQEMLSSDMLNDTGEIQGEDGRHGDIEGDNSLSFSETATVLFHDHPCRLTVKGMLPTSARQVVQSNHLPNSQTDLIQSGQLILRLEDEVTLSSWSGKYSAQCKWSLLLTLIALDIEEMTRKTGNFKRFSVFIEMILSSMKKTSKSVFLDFLTSQDLNAMKTKSSQEINSKSDSFNKIYFILTYAIAFDRQVIILIAFMSSIHFPLPLSLEDFHEDGHRQVLESLRQKVHSLTIEKENYLELHSTARRENDKLKHELKQLKSSMDQKRSTSLGSKPVHRPSRTLDKDSLQVQVVDVLDEIRLVLAQSNVDMDSAKTIHECLWQLEDLFVQVQPKRGPSQSTRSHSFKKDASPSKSSSQQGSSSRSKYTVIRSQPLIPKNLAPRQQPKKRTGSSSRVSKSQSPAPFKRFDPTEYVKEKERKMEERRSRSRGVSASSRGSTPARRSTQSNRSTKSQYKSKERPTPVYSNRFTNNEKPQKKKYTRVSQKGAQLKQVTDIQGFKKMTSQESLPTSSRPIKMRGDTDFQLGKST